MKPKKTASQRRRISFAVDRDEIEINSNWVEAVMGPPTAVPSPVADVVSDDFFVPDARNATVTEQTTGARLAPVVEEAPATENSSVKNKATDDQIAPDKVTAPVAVFSVAPESASATIAVDILHAPVELFAPGEQFAPVAPRRIRRRPIVRVTDGLTPGQYAVYSLMFGAGNSADGTARIYKGGYADLGRLTGLSKRGIQNIVAELQAKQVIRLHQHPGYHRTETSAYFVPDPESVVHTWHAKGWRFSIGKSKTLTA